MTHPIIELIKEPVDYRLIIVLTFIFIYLMRKIK